jgi:hypothetical protein
MRRLKPTFLWACLLVLACVLINLGVAGCSQENRVTSPTEDPPGTPTTPASRASDSGLAGDGGGVLS